jgi:hypothetical protein
MVSHTWTAKMQASLNLTHANWLAAFQQKPIDIPRFASQSIFELNFLPSGHSKTPLILNSRKKNIRPTVGTTVGLQTLQ